MALAAGLKWNRDTRDEFVKYRSRITCLFNDYIRAGQELAEKLNEIHGCNITIPKEMEDEVVFLKGPDCLRRFTQEIYHGLQRSQDSLGEPIDSVIFDRFKHLDVQFAEMAEYYKMLAAAGELLAAGYTGLAAAKAVANSTIKTAGTFEKVFNSPAGVGILTAVGVFAFLDLLSSLFIGSNEAKSLSKANEICQRFLSSETENLRKAARDMDRLAERIKVRRIRKPGEGIGKDTMSGSDFLGTMKRSLRLASPM